VFLLGQAGIPFTTGVLAKLAVVEAAVEAHSVWLAGIAMVSAVVAAFFYLGLVRLMWAAPAADAPVAGAPAGAMASVGAATASMQPAERVSAGALASPVGTAAGQVSGSAAGSPAGAGSTSGEEAGSTSEETEEPALSTPLGVGIAIALCAGVTVVFGVIPAPLLDFAHQATLLIR
jgi:NADH:ubiquinone oxidoreductase subunit 2 (subunit N)